MKSSFMLYILCMKISDPESRCYCTRSHEGEGRDSLSALSLSFLPHPPPLSVSRRELTFFMDTDSTGTPETAMYSEYAAYIVLSLRRTQQRGGGKLVGRAKRRGKGEGKALHTRARVCKV